MIFNHLHCHTQFSLLDGAADISKMLKKAKADNMSAVAITDHGNMFGVFEFVAQAAKVGIKPIVGCEFYLVDDRHKRAFTRSEKDIRYHQLMLAKDEEGYKNLIKLCSLGFMEGMYGKYPRIDKELVLKYHKGLIATTCCLGAEVPRTILKKGEEEAEKVFKWWLDLFGEDYYIELQRHQIPDQEIVNNVLLKFAKKYNVKVIASNDSHYINQDDANAHDILLCINTGEKQATPTFKDFSDEDDPNANKGKRFAFYNDQFYFKTTAEMIKVFQDVPQAIDNTNEIVDKCTTLKLKKDILLPNYPMPAPFTNQDDYLRHLTMEGARKRYGSDLPEKEERINFELNVIKNMGFAGYFLIVQDYINAGRDLGVFIGPGRGSAAGSAVAYCIGITNIDPIKYDLLFERFLNPDRKSMPDIDTDFDDEGRQKVIDYVVQKYGKNQVAQIVTYGTMAAKMSIKDVSRVLDLPLAEANMLAKLVPDKPGTSLDRVFNAPISGAGSLEEKDGYMSEDIDNIKKLREIYAQKGTMQSKVIHEALRLEGSVRNTGVHAAGIIIAPQDLTDLIPIAQAKDSELYVTQFEGKVIEDAGVIKMDFLGLKNLTIIRDALKMIKENHGKEFDIDDVPLDDLKTFELYQKGRTNGTFQFESAGMQKYLKELKPDKFEDLIAMNALYRPGPLAYIPNYIARKHGREPITYDLDVMEEYLHDTYGICVTGDTLVFDAKRGKHVRIDSLENQVGDFQVQGVDENMKTAFAKVSYWVCNGKKAVWEVKLSNGSTVKMTADHKVLTEKGWQKIGDLQAGDFIATPRKLDLIAEPEPYENREKLRVLAYLLADGAMSGCGSTAEFTSKSPELVEEYIRCLSGFERLEPRTLMQVREVTRVMVAGTDKTHYHETNSLVSALREWGLKTKTGGCTSENKFIPDFIFELQEDDIAYFLASLWDCDGHIGKKICFMKTISPQLAYGIQSLLLRLGIHSAIYETQYQNNRREGKMTAFQISVYNLKVFQEKVAPHLVLKSMLVESTFSGLENKDSLSREIFLSEFEKAWKGTKRGFMEQYGFDRQHLHPKRNKDFPRIAAHTIDSVINVLDLPQTSQNRNIRWVEIQSITPVGEELVYDITVDNIHNFVGNNVILHNCVYQEQIMLLSQKMAGFTKGDADVLRKAMGKKDKATLDKMKSKFIEGCGNNNLDTKICDKVWVDWEAFASYAFNKSHSTCYAFVAFQTAWLKAHYTSEYMASVLTHNSGQITKITFFMEECKSLGIAVLSPDVNESETLFSVNKKGEIRFGMGAIKGVGEAVVEKIIEERKINGPYKSLCDLVKRMPARSITKRVIEGLIFAGALDCFGAERYRYFLEFYDKGKEPTNFIEKALTWGGKMQSDKSSSLANLFGDEETDLMEAEPQVTAPDPNKAWSVIEELNKEKEVVGFYLSAHPLDRFRWQIECFPNIYKIGDLMDPENEEKPYNREIKLAGIITAVTDRVSGAGKKFVSFGIEDFTGGMELVLFGGGKEDMLAKFRPVLQVHDILLLTGNYQPRYNDPTQYEFRIKDIQSVSEELFDGMMRQLTVVFDTQQLTEKLVAELDTAFAKHKEKGKIFLQFNVRDEKLQTVMPMQSGYKIKVDKQLMANLEELGLAYTLG